MAKKSTTRSLMRTPPDAWVESLTLQELHRARGNLLNVMMTLSMSSAGRLADALGDDDLLSQCIDGDVVKRKLTHARRGHSSSELPLPVRGVYEELETLSTALAEAIESFDVDHVEKAEAVIRQAATNVRVSVEYEALVYLVSRGYRDEVNTADVRKRWQDDVFWQVEQRCREYEDTDTASMLKDQSLSLEAAADLLLTHDDLGMFTPFWTYWDEDEISVGATVLRTIEWLEIPGFDRWVDVVLSEFSNPTVSGQLWPEQLLTLFFCTRSTLAVTRPPRAGLEGLLWIASRGEADPSRPWRFMRDVTQRDDSLLYAACLAFAWTRIRPERADDKVLHDALALVLGHQSPAGWWSAWVAAATGDVVTTAIAVHALAVSQPPGWQTAARLAVDWLRRQQLPHGSWECKGFNDVLVTVLVLDALVLADGEGETTLGLVHAKPSSAVPDDLINHERAGEIAHVTAATIRRWIDAEKLAGYGEGRKVSEAELTAKLAFIQERKPRSRKKRRT